MLWFGITYSELVTMPENFREDPEKPSHANNPPETSEWSDPLGMYTENPTPEQLAALEKFREYMAVLDGADRAAILEKLDVGGKLSFEKIFELVGNAPANMDLPLGVAEKDLLKEFAAMTGESMELGESVGMLFDMLASGGLRKPNKEFTHTERSSALPDRAEFLVNQALQARALLPDESERLAAMAAILDAGFRESSPQRHEKQEGIYTYQAFIQGVRQDGGKNAIQEMVSNDVYDLPYRWNKCNADLLTFLT
jgi:hypothetical protein